MWPIQNIAKSETFDLFSRMPNLAKDEKIMKIVLKFFIRVCNLFKCTILILMTCVMASPSSAGEASCGLIGHIASDDQYIYFSMSKPGPTFSKYSYNPVNCGKNNTNRFIMRASSANALLIIEAYVSGLIIDHVAGNGRCINENSEIVGWLVMNKDPSICK